MKRVDGGYILKARCIQNSDIAHAPPHTRETWDLLLRWAFWEDGDKLKRGQVLLTVPDVREALHWYVGWRKEYYKTSQIESAMRSLSKYGQITKRKTGRGTVVTICNYELYQDPKNYERGTGRGGDRRKDHQVDARWKDEGIKKKNLKMKQKKMQLHTSSAYGCGEAYQSAVAALEQNPTMENAICCIRLCHPAFEAVEEVHLQNSLNDQPDRSRWHEAITGMANAYAGADMPRPNQTLGNWLHGKPAGRQAAALPPGVELPEHKRKKSYREEYEEEERRYQEAQKRKQERGG